MNDKLGIMNDKLGIMNDKCNVYFVDTITMADYSATTSGGECIFCKIASGEIPPLGDAVIYENDDYMAWLDPFPNTLGASVVILKQHYGSDNLKLPDAVLQAFILEAKTVAQLLEHYFDDVGRVGLMMEGTGIDHAHIKLYPMHGTEYMKMGEWRQVLSGDDHYFTNYPGYLSSNSGPQTDFDELEKLGKTIFENSKKL